MKRLGTGSVMMTSANMMMRVRAVFMRGKTAVREE